MVDENEGTQRLQGFMSPLGAWAYGVGTAIGWGSFVVTGNQYLLQAGPLGSVVGVLVGACFMLVIAYNYGYMMQRYPSAGGTYTHVRLALGHDYGFLVAWFSCLAYLAVFWANATSLPLFVGFFAHDYFKVGYLHTVFGYDVYLGEVLITVAAIVCVGVLCAASKRLKERFMISLIFACLVATGACFVGTVVVPQDAGAAFAPVLLPDKSVYSQLLSVTIMTPWAFIGFESISYSSEEFDFPRDRSFSILRKVVGVTTLLYLMIILISVSAHPARYGSWLEYLQDLGNLSGIEAIPPFFAAQAHMGALGVNLLLVALFALVLTSLIGNVVVLSRLLLALGREEIVPAGLAVTNEAGAPQRAIVLVVAVSLAVPLLGRTAIGWIVDVTTIAAVVVYALSSLSTLVTARREQSATACATGAVGVIAMVLLGLMTMLPSLFTQTNMAQESYFLVAVWAVLGFVYYRYLLRKDDRSLFGKTIVVWAFLLMLVLFTSTVWLQKSDQRIMSQAIADISAHVDVHDLEEWAYIHRTLAEANRANVRSSLMVTGVFVLALGMILADYRYVRRRQMQSDKELGVVREVAFTDALTGVKSKNAYAAWEERTDERIMRGAVDGLAVVVCDVNDLKRVNDTLGHQAGDDHLRKACRIVCTAFAHSPVFRVGGDEFVVVLEGSDFERRAEILASLNASAEKNARTGDVVVASGVADFDPNVDYAVSSVFARADTQMYQRKSQLKQLSVAPSGTSRA